MPRWHTTGTSWTSKRTKSDRGRSTQRFAPRMSEIRVTGNLEPHFPNSLRIPRIITGITCIIIMMVIVVIFIIAVIIYRVLIAIPLFQNPLLRSQASTVASGSAAIVHGYREGTLSSLACRNEECDKRRLPDRAGPAVAVIMIGKQIINNCRRKLFTWHPRFTKGLKLSRSQEARPAGGQADYQLIPYEGLFEEYLEMVLQFGLHQHFCSRLPLAAILRPAEQLAGDPADASKLVCETRGRSCPSGRRTL
uniref:Anoctamin n=1 Tax=Macrostomum lignano TaxID=282301 RepID=A0A1I8FDD3_9PLAT